VFWASDPVRPDETVLLEGSDFGPACRVELVRLKDDDATPPVGEGAIGPWSPVPVLQWSDCSLKFVVPASWKMGIFACRVVDRDSVSTPVLLNAPDPWWMQSDAGDRARPGGWLRVFGKSLGFAAPAIARLESASGRSTTLRAAAGDCYALRFDLPGDLGPGDYAVDVHNGFGGSAAWRKVGTLRIEPAAWPAAVFNVLDFYGKDAVAEGRKTLSKYSPVPDRTAGIQAALEKAKRGGGGVVYFPAGRYGMQGEIAVPPRTLLKGEGCGLVVLWWGSGRFNLDGGGQEGLAREKDEAGLPGTLIHGPEFGLEEMSLYFPLDYRTGITCERGFRMRHVRVRVDHYWVLDGSRRPEGTLARLGNNFEVSDCDLLAKGEGLIPGRNGLIARNRIMAGKTNCPLGGAEQVIVEDNHLVSLYPTAYQNIAGAGRNLYYARNRHEALSVHQADYSFTFDAGPSAYQGRVAAVAGTRLTLAADPTFPDWAKEGSDLWRKSVVCVLDGRGAGQWRRVTAHKGRTWELDRPLLCPPDATSTITIVPFNGRALVVQNRFEDANWVNAGYGTSIDVFYAGNRLYRCAQLLNYGIAFEDLQPSWYIQFHDNEILEGNTSVDTTGADRSGTSYQGPITRCVVHRRTTIAPDNSGGIHVGGKTRDVIVEGCILGHPAGTIRADGAVEGLLLRNNTFAGSNRPRYEGSQLGHALVLPKAE
jgi:hypothetical protein